MAASAWTPVDESAWKPVPESSQKELPGVPEQVMTSIQNQAKGLFETIHGIFDPRAAVKQGDEMLGAQLHEWDRAKENYAKGDYLGAVTGALGAAVPIIGPLINRTADKLATPGQRAEGATDIALPFLLGKAGPAVGEAASAVGDIASSAASKVAEMATKPSVVKAAGTAAGGIAGHLAGESLGIPYAGYAGAYIGRKVGAELSKSIGKAKAPIPESAPVEATPPDIPVPEGVDPKVWEALPPAMQEQLRLKTSGASTSSRSAPAPQAPRDPSYYGVGSEPNTPVRPPLAEKPAEAPAKPAENADLTGKLNDLLRKEKIKAGLDPDLPLGEVKGGRYLAKFDEGGGEAPVIQSQLRKPTSTSTEPANPSLIAKDIGEKLAGRITTEQFDSMSKNPKALAVITRQYGIEPDAALIKMIRRRIAAKSSEVTAPTTISIADLMKR